MVAADCAVSAESCGTWAELYVGGWLQGVRYDFCCADCLHAWALQTGVSAVGAYHGGGWGGRPGVVYDPEMPF